MYNSNLIRGACLSDTRIMDTSMELNKKLHPIGGGSLQGTIRYRQLDGGRYLAISRSNITYGGLGGAQFVITP